MIARTPFLDGIQRPHRHGLVETARRVDVVELILSGRRGLFGGVVRGDVAGIRWETLRRGGRLLAVWVLRTQELQTERGHPFRDRTIPGRQRQRVVIGGAVDQVEVPRRQDAVCARIGAADERRQILEDPVRRAIRVPHAPFAVG